MVAACLDSAGSSGDAAPTEDEDRVLPGLAAFLKFGSLSGLGWLLDFAILVLLVGFLGASTFAANLVSSSVAAMSVFLLSRSLIFTPGDGGLEIRLAFYFAYTFAMICIATAAMTLIVGALNALAAHWELHAGSTALAGIAKTLVTPPTLILNFFMSRYISERKLPARAWS